jgi:hypothetical protein
MIPITWHHDYPGSSRQVAKLGAIAVGAVGADIDNPKKARWAFWLPNETGSAFSFWTDVRDTKTATAEEIAKTALVEKVTSWLASAGILTLAERDRAAAAALPLFANMEQPTCQQ